MKNFLIPYFVGGLTTLRNVTLTLAGMTALSACASNALVKHRDSHLPIETLPSGAGSILSVRTHESADRLYVAGHARPHQLLRPAHVDIQLIGAHGRILAEIKDELNSPKHPRGTHARSGRHSYVASFPLSEACQAVKIRVNYHSGKHSS